MSGAKFLAAAVAFSLAATQAMHCKKKSGDSREARWGRSASMARLKDCVRRAQSGGDLTIGFLGGSITQGSLASSPDANYAYRVFRWWQETFPKARFQYVNAGIGGTTSLFGVARADRDILAYEPDFIVVDFAVNDASREPTTEIFEGLVRKLLKRDSRPAVVLLENVMYSNGWNAEEFHRPVAERYSLPVVSVRNTIYARMLKGELKKDEITPDGLHPNDKGHALVADEIIALLEEAKASSRSAEDDPPLPEPLTANAYEGARLLTIMDSSPVLDGFRADAEEKRGRLDFFKNGWIGRKAGDKISFKVDAARIHVQYRRTVRRPACRARLTLDGDKSRAIILDGNFDEDWGDCLFVTDVLTGGERKARTVEVEVIEGSDDLTPFYLMSLIVS